jgi:hypothetical protein
MPDYHSAFDSGEYVRIADTDTLRSFQQSWQWHHGLQDEQLGFAGKDDYIKRVSYYHGGTPLYEFTKIPGFWHEACLRDITIGEHPESGVAAADYYSMAHDRRSGLPVVIVRDPNEREVLVAFRICAERAAQDMRAVGRVRSRRMFEWKYGFDGIYESTKQYVDVA